MKEYDKPVYICEYCGKIYKTKSCKYHESICSKNPINHKVCYECINYKKEWLETNNPYGSNMNFVPFCTIKKAVLLNHKAIARKYNIKGFINIPMFHDKKDCKDYRFNREKFGDEYEKTF